MRDRQVVRLEPGTTKIGRGRTLPYGSLPELVRVALVERKPRDFERSIGTRRVRSCSMPVNIRSPLIDISPTDS